MSVKGMYHLDALFFIQVYLGFKFCPSLFEADYLESLLGFSETSLYSISALSLKIVLLLDAHQLLMLFAGTSKKFETKIISLRHVL
jgi:hypothetical protein